MTTPIKPTKTYHGYLCGTTYIDYDGSHQTAEWVEPEIHPGQPDKFRDPDSLGWYAWCIVEPEAGLIGPFKTEEEAIKTATDEGTWIDYMNRQHEEIMTWTPQE
jgi:hypothetical protein